MVCCSVASVKPGISWRLAPRSKVRSRPTLARTFRAAAKWKCSDHLAAAQKPSSQWPYCYSKAFIAPYRASNYRRVCQAQRRVFSRIHCSHARQFSTMAGVKIDGTAIAKKIREKLHSEIEQTQRTNPRFKPGLKILQIGDR